MAAMFKLLWFVLLISLCIYEPAVAGLLAAMIVFSVIHTRRLDFWNS